MRQRFPYIDLSRYCIRLRALNECTKRIVSDEYEVPRDISIPGPITSDDVMTIIVFFTFGPRCKSSFENTS